MPCTKYWTFHFNSHSHFEIENQTYHSFHKYFIIEACEILKTPTTFQIASKAKE